jgi:large subunit ribosomal protein L10
MKIDEKRGIVEALQDKLARSKVVIVTDYKGLDVAKLNELRGKLRASGVEYQVVKNTLLERASQNTDFAVIRDSLKGPSAIALSYDDPVAPAKVLTQFAQENDKLTIKAGVLKGKLIGPDGIKALSALPSREVLLGQVLSVMNAVPTSFVRLLNEIPRSFLNVLQAIKEEKEKLAA